MNEPIQIGIDSNAAAIIGRLERFTPEMQGAIAKALNLENELTIGVIQSKRLSQRGPTTLGVISNRLRSSLRRTDATFTATTVESAIGTNVRYMKPHEFGFDGTVTVRSHLARNAALDVYQFQGRQFLGWEVIGSGAKRPKRVAEGFATVRQHRRHMKIPARAPIRTTIAERKENYAHAVSGAILAAWQGGAS